MVALVRQTVESRVRRRDRGRYSTTEIPLNFGPVFYKPGLEGVGGARTWVETPADLPEEVRQPSSGFIFQEKIEGQDVYSFGFLADRGRIIIGAGLA
jgi:hypothetical protein